MDKESLMNIYCDIIRQVANVSDLLKKDKKIEGNLLKKMAAPGAIRAVIEVANSDSRTLQEYAISASIQDFKKKIEIEIKNVVNNLNLTFKKSKNV